MKELREALIENNELMASGKRDQKLGKEITNVAGKLLTSLAIDMKYQEHLHFEKDIDYLYSKEERLHAIEEKK